MYFLRCGDTTVVGASPEVMVRLEGGRISFGHRGDAQARRERGRGHGA